MQSDHLGFLTTFLPFERRRLTRTGINLHCLQYWADPLAPWIGSTVEVHYDPRDITVAHVRGPSGVVVTAHVTTPGVPAISLAEWQSRRLGERAFSRNPEVQAQADACLLRSDQTIKQAKKARRTHRRQATQAAGDAWRAASVPTQSGPQAPVMPMTANAASYYEMEF